MTFSEGGRRALAASSLALLLAGCATGGGERDTQVGADGPLRGSGAHGWSIDGGAGARFTDGLEVVDVASGSELTIKDIDLEGARGMRLIGAMVAPPPREFASLQYIPSWPPVDPDLDEVRLVDAEGAVLRAADDRDEQGWELLLGIEVTDARTATRSGIDVTYEAGGKTFVLSIPAELQVCVGQADCS